MALYKCDYYGNIIQVYSSHLYISLAVKPRYFVTSVCCASLVSRKHDPIYGPGIDWSVSDQQTARNTTAAFWTDVMVNDCGT